MEAVEGSGERVRTRRRRRRPCGLGSELRWVPAVDEDEEEVDLVEMLADIIAA